MNFALFFLMYFFFCGKNKTRMCLNKVIFGYQKINRMISLSNCDWFEEREKYYHDFDIEMLHGK
jgi:hypothetical protein